jgi:hypothetical protein
MKLFAIVAETAPGAFEVLSKKPIDGSKAKEECNKIHAAGMSIGTTEKTRQNVLRVWAADVTGGPRAYLRRA